MWRVFALGGLILPFSILCALALFAAIILGRSDPSAWFETLRHTSPYILFWGIAVALVELPRVAVDTRCLSAGYGPYVRAGCRIGAIAPVVAVVIYALMEGGPQLFAETAAYLRGKKPPFDIVGVLYLSAPLSFIGAIAGSATACAYYWLGRWFVFPRVLSNDVGGENAS